MSKAYVIGDKDVGIIFVLTDPARVVLVERSEIEAAATSSGRSFDEVFQEYLAGAIAAVSNADVAPLPASNLQYGFEITTDADQILAGRSRYTPVEGALISLAGK